jgi:hypothetical protein
MSFADLVYNILLEASIKQRIKSTYDYDEHPSVKRAAKIGAGIGGVGGAAIMGGQGFLHHERIKDYLRRAKKPEPVKAHTVRPLNKRKFMKAGKALQRRTIPPGTSKAKLANEALMRLQNRYQGKGAPAKIATKWIPKYSPRKLKLIKAGIIGGSAVVGAGLGTLDGRMLGRSLGKEKNRSKLRDTHEVYKKLRQAG